ncbi:MAG: lytic murein transglycosylase [Bacteroidetes bacterium]|nr:MAG: lytic murein transglycosylase [Bacteroidota bacterium]
MSKLSGWLKQYRKKLLVVPALIVLLVIVRVFVFSSGDPVSDDAYRNYFNANYKVFGITIPKDLNFAGEGVPVDDFTVRESLERELMVNTYWQSQTLLFHKKASRWFPVIEPVLKRNGIPDDFKYIVVIESGFSNVVSPQQATGFWQFIEPTAKNYGLEISEDVDERYHVEKSTEAACKYFREAYAKYKNWTLAAASYNLGMGGVDKQLDRQKSGNYYDLYLNEETARYVFRLLAVKEILTKPKTYGYQLRQKDLYPPVPTVTVKVDSGITDLPAFALAQGYTYKMLKYFNPWLISGKLNNPEKKTYLLQFPKKGVKVYGFEEDAPGIPGANPDTASRFVTPSEVKSDSLSHPLVHYVKEGELLAKIAGQYKVTEEELRVWNKIPGGEEPKAGTEIVILRK